jgi:hypothetical protein
VNSKAYLKFKSQPQFFYSHGSLTIWFVNGGMLGKPTTTKLKNTGSSLLWAHINHFVSVLRINRVQVSSFVQPFFINTSSRTSKNLDISNFKSSTTSQQSELYKTCSSTKPQSSSTTVTYHSLQSAFLGSSNCSVSSNPTMPSTENNGRSSRAKAVDRAAKRIEANKWPKSMLKEWGLPEGLTSRKAQTMLLGDLERDGPLSKRNGITKEMLAEFESKL